MKKKYIIEDETPIIPWLIAESVAREAYTITGSKQLTDQLTAHLVEKAERIYQNNADFRKGLKSEGGRDKLYMFMRHWSAAFLCTEGVARNIIPVRWINGLSLPKQERATTDNL
jgi:hypothetical protein